MMKPKPDRNNIIPSHHSGPCINFITNKSPIPAASVYTLRGVLPEPRAVVAFYNTALSFLAHRIGYISGYSPVPVRLPPEYVHTSVLCGLDQIPAGVTDSKDPYEPYDRQVSRDNYFLYIEGITECRILLCQRRFKVRAYGLIGFLRIVPVIRNQIQCKKSAHLIRLFIVEIPRPALERGADFTFGFLCEAGDAINGRRKSRQEKYRQHKQHG